MEGIEFLSEYNINGQCSKLVDNKCTIYESRPLLCRIDESYDQIFSTLMTKEEFYVHNAMACNALQEKLRIDTSYRVYIDKSQKL
ncbi:MAG: YkgJ family cysteine cluster protein [Psychrobacillus psychrotolerans]